MTGSWLNPGMATRSKPLMVKPTMPRPNRAVMPTPNMVRARPLTIWLPRNCTVIKAWMLPAIIAATTLFGWSRGVRVYDTLLDIQRNRGDDDAVRAVLDRLEEMVREYSDPEQRERRRERQKWEGQRGRREGLSARSRHPRLGKAWQTVSWLVRQEATEEATVGTCCRCIARAITPALNLPDGRIA